jgi:hypothetical protein
MTDDNDNNDDDKGKGSSGKGSDNDGKGKGGHPGKCGNHDSKGKGGKGDNDGEKDSRVHFVSFALHRFIVLCSGKGNDEDGKGNDGTGKGNDNDNVKGKGDVGTNYDKDDIGREVMVMGQNSNKEIISTTTVDNYIARNEM